MAFVDMKNKTFGRWKVIERAEKDKRGEFTWVCKCECGTVKKITGSSLRTGNSTSCGCYARENPPKKTHGKSSTALYNQWKSMKSRCHNKNSQAYKHYGGRGIKVCQRWRNSFQNFVDDMGKKPKNMSLERIDNNGNYEPKNCKWASNDEQANNKRTSRIITFKGQSKTLMEWSKETGISVGTLWKRLDMGWNEEKTLTKQIKK